MFWWWHFDLQAARLELARLAAAGFRHVRFFLLWEAFQIEPGSVVETALRDLEAFATAADEAGLLLQPTLFTGHMSGANWVPQFATAAGSGQARFPTLVSGRPRALMPASFYAEERLLQAQELLAREIARVLAQHPAMWSWDLGNEHSNVAVPESRDQARRWLARMVGALRAGGSEHPVTIGLHMEDLEEDRQLGPREAAEYCDYLCMHGYPLYADWARHGLDAAVLPFLALITGWLGGKPVLFQEFGLPVWPTPPSQPRPPSTRVLFEDAQAEEFYREGLRELRQEQLMGAFAWCANDYAEHLWSRPPLAENVHERFFGLYRADGSPKRALEPWVELNQGLVGAPKVPARGFDWIDIDQDHYWQRPAYELRRLYGRFLDL